MIHYMLILCILDVRPLRPVNAKSLELAIAVNSTTRQIRNVFLYIRSKHSGLANDSFRTAASR